MSPWVKFILPKIGQSIAGANWEHIVGIVRGLGVDSTMTGAQKREQVKEIVIEFGEDMAGFMLNLAIEIAVAWLRAKGEIQAGEEKK